MKCAKCGAEIRTGCVYCSNCGQEAQIVTEVNVLEDDLLRSMLEEEQRKKEASEASEKNQENSEKKVPKQKKVDKEEQESQEKQKKSMRRMAGIICLLALIGAAVMTAVTYQRNHSASYLMGKAENCYNRKDYQNATEYLDKALALNGKNADALRMKGQIALSQGERAQAEKLFLQLLEIRPDDVTACENLLKLYDSDNRYQDILNLKSKVNMDDADISALVQSYVVEPPLISAKSGNYSEFFDVEISAEKGNKIYYTLDGSKPDKRSTLYEKAVKITARGETTLRAVCCDAKGNLSEIAEETYNIELRVPDMPEVTPDSGRFMKKTSLTVKVPEGTSVYYTWDGTTPTRSSRRYSGPIEVPEGNNILSLIAIDGYGMKSNVQKCNYIYYPE